jgi:hypothetical protein
METLSAFPPGSNLFFGSPFPPTNTRTPAVNSQTNPLSQAHDKYTGGEGIRIHGRFGQNGYTVAGNGGKTALGVHNVVEHFFPVKIDFIISGCGDGAIVILILSG